MLKFMLRAVAALAICAECAVQARADILFNDYGPSYTYNVIEGWPASGSGSRFGSPFVTASQFTPSETAEVTSVAFGISLVSGTNSVNVDLMTDNGGAPGSVLEGWSFSGLGPFGSQNPALTALSALNPILTAGTNYWVAVFPGASDTWAFWNLNDQNVTGVQGLSLDGSTWTPAPENTLGAFEIDGIGAAVPEPSRIAALLGLALMGLIGLAWRPRGSAKRV